MPENHFVLQMRKKPWEDNWITLPEKYPTLEKAKKALAMRSPKSQYRIARAYVQVRYKAVREG